MKENFPNNSWFRTSITRSLFLGLLFFGQAFIKVHGQELPTGFSIIEVTDEVENVSCFAFLDENTILLAKQNGEIYRVSDGLTSAEPIVRIPTITTANGGDRGLVGISIDPDYPQSPYVYVTFTVEEATHNRVSRFKYVNSTIDLSSEEVLVELSPINAKWHVGGAIVFDNQGHLYTTTGDNSTPSNAQDMSTTHGKIIRINKDGSIPEDNPFYGNGGVQDLFWAIGLRNPYTMAIHKNTNTIYVNDVGKTEWEEINDATIGGRNFGWPIEDGYNKDAASPYEEPTYAYAHAEVLTDSTGIAITGGAFYETFSPAYPSEYLNKYFFLEFGNQWINTITPEIDSHDHTHDLGESRQTFGTNLPKGGIYLQLGPDGFLYYFSRLDNALYKIVYYDSEEPLILAHPENTTTMLGERTRFSITAVGEPVLHYEWFKDGVLLANAADSPDYSFGNTQEGREGTYQVRVYNEFGEAYSNEFTLDVIPFNGRPSVSITTPADSTLYRAGQLINFKATANDPEEGQLSADRFEWFLEFHHDDHIHDGPAIAVGVKEGSFEIPDLGETSSNVWYKLRVKVEDELGQITTNQRRLFPMKTEITFQTEPAGLQINVDGPGYDTPLIKNFVEGLRLPVAAATQTVAGENAIYRFSHWSGPVEDSFFLIPEEDTILTAYFEKCTNPSGVEGFRYTIEGQKVLLHWESAASACTQGFTISNLTSAESFDLAAEPQKTDYEFELPASLAINTTYNLSIKAYNEFGESSVSNLTFTLTEDDLNGEINYIFFPNPSVDQLTISGIDVSEEFSLQFFNLSGQAVTKKVNWAVEGNDVVVDISNLASGLYFMELSAGGKSKTLKVMID